MWHQAKYQSIDKDGYYNAWQHMTGNWRNGGDNNSWRYVETSLA